MLESVGRELFDVMDSLLYHRLISLRHDLETLGRCLKRLHRLRRVASLLQCQPNGDTECGVDEYSVFAVASGWNQSPPSRRRHLLKAILVDIGSAEGL
jgi:hypothetical protein